MNKRDYMNTSVQEPPLDYSFRSIHVIQGQPPEHSTALTKAAGPVWSLGRNHNLLLKSLKRFFPYAC
ncbi:LRTOMT isoform 22, partial [Pongo abelii]